MTDGATKGTAPPNSKAESPSSWRHTVTSHVPHVHFALTRTVRHLTPPKRPGLQVTTDTHAHATPKDDTLLSHPPVS